MLALSDWIRAGHPSVAAASATTASAPAPVHTFSAADATSSRLGSSMTLRILTSVRAASCQVVSSSCEDSFARVALNRRLDRFGALLGSGVMNPRVLRRRYPVAGDGGLGTTPATTAATSSGP